MSRQMLSISIVLLVVLIAGSALVVPGHAAPAAAQASPVAESTPCPTTTEEENEALIRRYREEAWSQGNLDVIDEIWAEPPSLDAPVTQYATRDDLKARIREFRTAFPDLHVEVLEVVTEGNVVVARNEWTGTHLGEFDGIPPTGRKATWSGLEMARIECGQIVASWVQANGLDLRRDLGIITEEELADAGTPTVATPVP